MTLRVGLVGPPNVGKSTLFNALSQAGAEVANFPFCTIEPNVGVVPVPDPRTARIADITGAARSVPTTIEFLDIAGLVEGASRGEGLGNRFLAAIREVDAVCHVVRCFDDPDVAHVAGAVDPVRDVRTIETELLLRDLETVETRLERERRATKSGDEAALAAVEELERLREHLRRGDPARTFSDAAADLLDELFLLTRKPVVYAANVADTDLPDGGERTQAVRDHAAERGAEVVVVSAAVEAELHDLPDEERDAFRAALGLERSGLERLIDAARRLLGLITFFTVNEKEARAWTVPAGTSARSAAGRIHTDMERGFIRAEVAAYEDLEEVGSYAALREEGLLRTEGQDYTVEDGDLLLIRFNA